MVEESTPDIGVIGNDNLANRACIPSFPALDKQYTNNTKIARVISTKNIEISNSVKSSGFEVKSDKSLIFVDLWADPNISLSQQITPFDMIVMDAAYTIYNHGYQCLTAEWIAKVLSGNRFQKVTTNKLDAINKSIDKLRNIHIKIDAKNEIASRNDIKGKVTDYIYESYLLPVDKITTRYKANGKAIIAYEFIKKPALYEYAEVFHQIIHYPTAYLQTQKYFQDTDEAILIKRYVIKRVAQIKSNNKLSNNKISFEWSDKDGTHGLYVELGYSPDKSKSWRTKIKPKIVNVVKETLNALLSQGVIKGFNEYRNGKSRNPAEPVMGYEVSI